KYFSPVATLDTVDCICLRMESGSLYTSTIIETAAAISGFWTWSEARHSGLRLMRRRTILLQCGPPTAAKLFLAHFAPDPLACIRNLLTVLGSEELLFESKSGKVPMSWSPDGKSVLFLEGTPANVDLWILPLSGDKKPSPYLNSRFLEVWGQISPDGHWVAYMSNESGQFEIYVQGLRNLASKFQVSTSAGLLPRWRADGKELFFMDL